MNLHQTETQTEVSSGAEVGLRIARDVLEPMKRRFVGKDEVIDLLGVSLIGRENLFILGPPGTAKSALVHDLARRFDGTAFDYLLTSFTEPNELFGPFDIRKLRDGELTTNTEGMLPEASFVFLDELLNANSAILNSLLMVLNERVFRRGRETRQLPLLMTVGASNRLPDDDALGALFDRFLLRVVCDNVEEERLRDVLDAGWQIERGTGPDEVTLRIEEVERLHRLIHAVELEDVRGPYVQLVHRLRHAGIAISDRRAVKLQRLIAASALLCGRMRAAPSDMWVMRFIWDTREQQEVIGEIVDNALAADESADDVRKHPRAMGTDAPDAEAIARELNDIAARLEQDDELPEHDRHFLRDRVGVLSARSQWVTDEEPRQFLEQKVSQLWERLGTGA